MGCSGCTHYAMMSGRLSETYKDARNAYRELAPGLDYSGMETPFVDSRADFVMNPTGKKEYRYPVRHEDLYPGLPIIQYHPLRDYGSRHIPMHLVYDFHDKPHVQQSVLSERDMSDPESRPEDRRRSLRDRIHALRSENIQTQRQVLVRELSNVL